MKYKIRYKFAFKSYYLIYVVQNQLVSMIFPPEIYTLTCNTIFLHIFYQYISGNIFLVSTFLKQVYDNDMHFILKLDCVFQVCIIFLCMCKNDQFNLFYQNLKLFYIFHSILNYVQFCSKLMKSIKIRLTIPAL